MSKNNKTKIIIIITIAIISIFAISGLLISRDYGYGWDRNGNRYAEADNSKGKGYNRQNEDHQHYDVSDMEKYELSSEQKQTISYMYQEEKMARDLYVAFYKKWQFKVFDNISRSEQNHMDEIKELLVKYDMSIPSNRTGEFENTELKKMYNELLEIGEKTSEEALKVAIKLEEHDIKDLEKALENATPDLKYVYTNLIEGSKKHLIAFKRNLDRENGNYGNGQGNGNGRRNGGYGRNNNGRRGGGYGRYGRNDDRQRYYSNEECDDCDNCDEQTSGNRQKNYQEFDELELN